MFAVERGPDGVMLPTPPKAGRAPTVRELFERKCFLLGITSPEKVAALWEAEKVRHEKPAPAKGRRKR